MAQYGKASYWDDRYNKDPEAFDWYQRYSGLSEIMSKYIKRDDAILMAGCGNSRMTEDMIEDGYTSITNIDVSRVVIDQMKEKYKDKKDTFIYQIMNVCGLEFPDESFDAIIAKGVMDAILCGEGSTANVAKMCMEASRVLKPNGVLFIVSYGFPDNRLQYLDNEDYSWKVSTHTVPKPTVSAASGVANDTADASSVHYIYVCQKGAGGTDDA
uniref:Methyltransferase type 11 domain-containing protein n=1 Tax=Aureoumbra lagunensis TaxID=44058 RepID=A0A7S3K5J8_9STRA|mmetsp:Transcript_17951/g.23386  ORF Transcript_17951/g.23386 Transcript_17951/m.23386 type:complete len:213 (-) Transcript_17951:611-1249(-)|eukprot:CAMPEP_0197285674 /NCGR_PEP_ID=MMETSP0890-20130614/1050_1 /TAXON_ID=44058 ORGANISM="Aureoumbra lagunensis, Strain CCMP1510" /NCGR_SAMPLE_ID=MMETSP0890 /ASSEMBLY_ACC=CAM_ASM_000533 /LENGTH=212 /DNA_ID=CAMNT_0042753439 /DNA_START=55 /DNA_END=693 /DNA_ORIENTATION=+